MLPKISIITVCYNAETLIERTIRSVIAQTYPYIEYIIIDGKSTDQTMKIVHDLISVGATHISASLNDHISTSLNDLASPLRQTQIISESDQGIYDAMNKGLSLATGDYVWFINAGDEIYEPTTLEKLIPFFEKNADVIYGDTVETDESRNILGFRKKRPPEKFTWKSFRKGMLVCHQSILVARKIAPKYDLQYKFCADIDWVIKAMKQAKNVGNSHQILSRFLVGGFSRVHEKASWKERFVVMKKHYGLLQTLLFHVSIVMRYFM